jgi:hypothetical protein
MAATGVVLPAVARRPGTAREHDLGRVRHPDHLAVAGRNLTLVDDPLVAPLAAGYPPLGWEGDGRLALYIDRRRGEWVLVRFEADATYRIVANTDFMAQHLPPADVVGQLIAFLVSHDSRRGFDALVAVDAHNARTEAAAEAALVDEMTNEVAPRLRHAFRKDGL